MLNTFLQVPDYKKIIDIDFIPQEEQPEIIGSKTIRFDIICRDENNNTFIVEMQKHKEPGFTQRTIYYFSKVYSSQLKKGGKYTALQPVMLLVFLNFELYPKLKNYINHFKWKNEDNIVLSEDARITYVEIPKYKKDTIETIEDEWMYLFKDYKTKGELKKSSKELKSAFEILKSMSNEEIEEYDLEVKKTLDLEGMLEEKKEEGIKIGEEKGRQEIIIEMVHKNIPLAAISEITKKTLEELAIILLKSKFPIENVLLLTEFSKEKVLELQKQV